MRYLLDTNVRVDLLRTQRSAAIRRRMDAINPADIALCSVVRFELTFGAMRSASPQVNLRAVELFLSGFESFPFDDDAARIAAFVDAALKAAGTPIGGNDLLIAAVALARKLTLVTSNIGEFTRVPGLAVADWRQT